VRHLPDHDDWLTHNRRAIGARIRAERERQNLTQDDVWIAARMSRWTLQRVEAGEDFTMSTLQRIAYVLDVPLADFVAEE
jgi:transcriptional regulator with XRE-family HTH domain